MPAALKFIYGATALWSLLLIAASRDVELPPEPAVLLLPTARAETPPPISSAENFQDRWLVPPPLPPPKPPPTDAVIVVKRQPHAHDNICPNGRRYYYRKHYRYWRCRR